jgi:uncharacterized SAM-binding protein YcdF (DUF218 family)
MQIFRSISCILVLVLLWMGAVVWFAYRIDSYSLADDVKTDAIIVLTGGGGRIDYGLELLGKGRAPVMFISGVNKSVPLGELVSKAPDAVRGLLNFATLGKITLGHEASNTIGNAQESFNWIKKNKYQSVLLVTADYHMPRALAEFNAAFRKEVQFIPAPVDSENYRDLSWVNDAHDRNLVLSEFHKLIAAKLRHMLIESSAK